MKKTLTINLNSTVFNIDEDAYEKLQGYLNELRLHLEKDECDEVMQDIEARVGELFGEQIGRYKSVIQIEDVEKVIETLGSPDSFGPITEERRETPSRSRKFYRSSDNHIIGGVAGGVAALVGWDVTLVRLIFFVLLCASFGWMTLIYILLWIIVPEARTVAQKLEMQGIEPSLQNISDYSHNNVQAEPSRGNNVFKTLLKVIGVLVLMPIIMLLLAIVVGILFASVGMLFSATPDLLGLSSAGWNWSIAAVFLVLALASVIIPLVFIIKLIVRAIRHTNKETNRKSFIIWLIIWIACVIGTMCTLFSVAKDGVPGIMKELREAGIFEDYSDEEMVTEVRCEGMAFNKIDASKIEMIVMKDTIDMVEVKAPATLMRNVTVDVIDSVLTIDMNKKRVNNDWVKVVVHHTCRISEVNLSTGAELKGKMFADSCLTIEAQSGAEVSLDELNTPGRVDVNAHSGAEVEIERLNAALVNMDMSSGADAELEGTVRRVNVEANSGAAINLKNLSVDSLSLKLTSGANVKRPKQKYTEITNN